MSKPGGRGRPLGRRLYLMPETVPLVLCSACIQIALEESPKAKEVYRQIVECYRLPDLEKAIGRLELKVPDSKELGEKIVKRLGLDNAQEKAKPGLWLPDGKTLKSLEEMTKEYYGVFNPWIDWKRGKTRSRDFAHYFERIREFVKVGFNSESGQRVDSV